VRLSYPHKKKYSILKKIKKNQYKRYQSFLILAHNIVKDVAKRVVSWSRPAKTKVQLKSVSTG
jgi:hypothetical protein